MGPAAVQVSERDIVVLEVATGGLAGGRSAARRLVPHAITATGTAAASQHLHLVHHDLGDVMLLPFFLVIAGAQAAFDVYLGALAHILTDDLRKPVIEGEPVPFGALLLLARLLVLPGLVGGRREVDHCAA